MEIGFKHNCLRVFFGIDHQIHAQFDYELRDDDTKDTFSYHDDKEWVIGFGQNGLEETVIKWR